jgi:Holliday junction DNA helicase RuvA
MIAHLRGRFLTKEPNRVIVEAAGVGYELAISIPTYSELPNANSEVALHVHTHVREDALTLFGFLKGEEKRVFERLIAVSGIGPKLAITILSGMSAEHLVAALRGNDVASLTKIPGIGKKTAERMVLELRDKLDTFAAAPAKAAPAAIEADVISALTNLGYPEAAAEKAVSAASAQERASFDALFKAAMARLRR